MHRCTAIFVSLLLVPMVTMAQDFPTRASLAVGTGPVSVAIGDLNGDGKAMDRPSDRVAAPSKPQLNDLDVPPVKVARRAAA